MIFCVVGGIIYPVIFRQLQPTIGLGWAKRVIAFSQLVALIVPVFGMRERVPSTTLRRLLDWRLFKKWSFLLILFGMLFGYMGIYISFCYIELYALAKCRTPYSVASYILTVTNAGSLVGRLVPTYFADRFLGPINVHTLLAFAGAIFAFAWIGIGSTAGIIVFGVIYGFISGGCVSHGGPVVIILTEDLQIMGTCLRMITGACGLGLLIGNPIAGVILESGGWTGLQVWNGTLLFVAGFIFLGSRVGRYGMKFGKKV